MIKPEISIIITCYNHEKYIGECIDSVLDQTFKNWECIVVNDGSTDNSANVIVKYAKKNKKIKIINQSNTGVVTARNNGIKNAQGKYIFPLDGDDKISPDCLAKLYEAMEQKKGDIIFSLVDFFGNMSGRFELELPTKQNMIFCNRVVCSALYKKSDFEKYGGYDINMNKGYEDWEFWLNFVEDNKVFHRIDEVLFFYRKISVSRSTGINNATRNMLKRYIYKKHKKLFFYNLHLFAYKYIKNYLYSKKKKLSNQKIVCIKNPAFDNIDKVKWGDYWLGLDLAYALKQKGYSVVTNYNGRFHRNKDADINIVIRGLSKWKNIRHKKINVLYIISHPDDIKKNELKHYDIIISASLSFYNKLKEKGYNAYYLPQFTNTDRFYNEQNDNYKNQILFIGAPHHGMRNSVKYALRNKLPISIYGHSWEKYIDEAYIKDNYIDNMELYKYYSNADIVLNDTMQNMKDEGFISNRIYDVTACKGFLISDYMPEIEEIYGDAIPMYKNEQEFVELISYYLNHPEERKKKAEKAHKITIRKYTNEYFANELKNILDNYKRDKKTAIRFWFYDLCRIFKKKKKK